MRDQAQRLDDDLLVRRCIEPRRTPEMVDVLMEDGGPEARSALVGLPYALVWDCERLA